MDGLKQTMIAAYFFKTSSGKEPVRQWLKNLPKEEKRIIGIDIRTVQYGWPIGMPLVKHMGDGIWEIRSSLPNKKISRVLFFMHEDKIILLNAFIKKSQKAPKEEINLAKRRMRQYINGGYYE